MWIRGSLTQTTLRVVSLRFTFCVRVSLLLFPPSLFVSLYLPLRCLFFLRQAFVSRLSFLVPSP